MFRVASHPLAFSMASPALCVAASFKRIADVECHGQPPHKVALGDAYLCSYKYVTRIERRGSKQWQTAAAENESQSEFEIDQDKAREALSKLDQQLETLSKKRDSSLKITATDLSNNFYGNQMRDEKPEISGSFLAYTAFALFAFTIFYNVLFLTVIKPSIDLPLDGGTASTQSRVADNRALLQPQLLSSQLLSPESFLL